LACPTSQNFGPAAYSYGKLQADVENFLSFRRWKSFGSSGVKPRPSFSSLLDAGSTSNPCFGIGKTSPV
jgi:hypothetical protein